MTKSNVLLKVGFGIINLIIIFSFILGFTKIANSSDVENLTIFSEDNMTYALTKIVRQYSKKKSLAISVNFNSSNQLIENIDLGEPADIFISSHLDWVTNLSQKGLVDQYNSSYFAQDKLVLVTSKNNPKIDLNKVDQKSSLQDILQLISDRRVPLIIGSEFTSLGRYTKKIIDDSNISDFQIFQKLDEDKKSIISFINEYNDYCAIVMASDVQDNDDIFILSTVPSIIIDYKALVIAGHNMARARDFIEYLKSDVAREILLKEGFI